MVPSCLKSCSNCSRLAGRQSASLDEVKDYIDQRQIKKLVHFTRSKNLNSILNPSHGLLTQQMLANVNKEVVDVERWDGHPNMICLSVSRPNYFMFKEKINQYAQKTNDMSNPWCVLEICPCVLWNFHVNYFIANASSSRVKPLSGLVGLREMFASKVLDWERKSNEKPYLTTNRQAEVHVLPDDGRLPSDYIASIAFLNDFNLTANSLLLDAAGIMGRVDPWHWHPDFR